jgi:F0F1-type ATP synthase assembly protein I
MNLGVLVADVVTYGETTLTNFGAIIALFLGLGAGLSVIRRFVKR